MYLNISRTATRIKNQSDSIERGEIGLSVVLVKHSVCNIKPLKEVPTLLVSLLFTLSLYYT